MYSPRRAAVRRRLAFHYSLRRADRLSLSEGNQDEIRRAKAESVAPGPDDEILNDDERQFLSWKSRYPAGVAQRKIAREAAYTVGVVAFSVLGLFVSWHGYLAAVISTDCVMCDTSTLRQYLYLSFAGLLGGSLFALKYLYKVVARGYWNEDRALWRYTSPILSSGLALAVGALTDAGLFGFATHQAASGSSFVALGFIVGYFADSASRKMQEVAETLFGHPLKKRSQ